jgi:hypothetical protein
MGADSPQRDSQPEALKNAQCERGQRVTAKISPLKAYVHDRFPGAKLTLSGQEQRFGGRGKDLLTTNKKH